MRERDYRNYGRQEGYRSEGQGYPGQRPERGWEEGREGGGEQYQQRRSPQESRPWGWPEEGDSGQRGDINPYGSQQGYSQKQGYGGSQSYGPQGGSAWGGQPSGGGWGQFAGGEYESYGQAYGGQPYGSQYGSQGYGGGYGTPGGYGGWEGFVPQQGYRRQGIGKGSWGGSEPGGGRQGGLTEAIRSFFGKGPRDYRRSDDRIREDVSDRLTDHPGIDATDVVVVVEEAVVTLDGTVEDRQMKHMAEDVAESVSGVRDVNNRLRVAPSRERQGQGEGQQGGQR